MRAPKDDRVVRVPFTDGVERDVCEDGEGRQYVVDKTAGERVYGVWVGLTDEPAVVE